MALGAWAAHGLEAAYGPRAVSLVDTAVRYQLWHTLGIVGAMVLYRIARLEHAPAAAVWLARAAQLFALGILLFCGSLYILAFAGPGWLGAITPVGGFAFIAGWLALGWGAMRAFANDKTRG